MSDDKVKGYSARLIHPPGYRLHSRYDLVHTRHLVDTRKAKKKHFTLNLAPMVDMFSILVIYLLMSFSSSGEAFFISKDITIPKAKKGLPMQTFPLISVLKDGVAFDVESKEEGDSPIRIETPNDGNSPELRSMLRQLKAIEIQIDPDFKGQVNIQADQSLPVEEVKKVMRILIDEGWVGINFIVDPST